MVTQAEVPPSITHLTVQQESGMGLDLIKALAMEIGRSAVAYVEVMYPEAIEATSSTFKLSLKNEIYNTIVSISELHDEPSARARLARMEAHRREWVGMYRKMRRKPKNHATALGKAAS